MHTVDESLTFGRDDIMLLLKRFNKKQESPGQGRTAINRNLARSRSYSSVIEGREG